jgi:membrane associated rhomboid family serine protease
VLIPIHVYVPTDERPFINVSLIVITCAISVAALLGDSGALFEDLAGLDMAAALKGRAIFAQDHLPLPVLAVTSTLLHVGWLHLIGNILFLWVFGNAVEYKFRHHGYIGLYLVCALASGMLHYAVDGHPFVGASGALNGIMGAFIVFFPRNDVKMAFIWFPVVRTFTVSSVWIILFYVAWDALFIVGGVTTTTAAWAHVGGFLAGFLIAFVCAYRGWLRPEEDEQTLLQVLGPRAE